MNKFLLCSIFVLFSTRVVYAQDDPALTLAQILSEKGTISAADLARVQTAEERNRLSVLASILQDKGLLNQTDLARLSLPSSPAGPAASTGVLSAATAPVPPPQRPENSPASTVAVTTKKGLPVSLYGTLLFTTGFNTANFNYEDVPMIASKQGSDPISSDAKNFYATARQTRLGLNLDPLETLGGQLSGRFEFDLMGGAAPYANGVNMGLFRLRLAYGRIDWSHWAVEAGQDWSIFAPLNPTSMNEYGIPEFTAAGNAWIRAPQLRIEAKTNPNGGTGLLWQLSASDPNMADNSTTSVVVTRQPGIGERGRMPSLQSRLALSKSENDRTYTVGLNGTYGRGVNAGVINGVEIQPVVNSWGVALDYTLPFTSFFNVTGEAYDGRGLGIYSVASGEAIGAVGTPSAKGLLSRGGWIQGQFNFAKIYQVNLAYGIDNPDAAELAVGSRNRNQQYMANIIDKLTKNVNLSLEYRRILTDYRNQLFANERGDHIDLGIAYIF